MAEISMKARDQMWQILHDHKKEDEWATVVFAILAIPELAIVDRETELLTVYEIQRNFTGLDWSTCENLHKWLCRILKGWVKEVKD